MKVGYLPHLTAQHVSVDTFENLVTVNPQLPSFKTKSALDSWRNDNTTKHCFFSPYLGVVEHSRVTGFTGETSNPPWVLGGFVADYDSKYKDIDHIVRSVEMNAAPGLKPTWVTQTFSGNAQVIWEFETPINVVNPELLNGFVSTFCTMVRANRLCANLDENCKKGFLYYTYYPGYQKMGTPVPTSRIEDILYKVGTSLRNIGEGETALPWDVIEKELHRVFPGRWTKPVEDGSRGPRFWDATSSHDNAAILRPTGVHYFTDGGGFLPWSSPSLFGPAFVKKYEADRISGAVSNIYYDGRKFYRYTGKEWIGDNLQVTALNLASNGLSKTSVKGRPSEVDEALSHIAQNQRIGGALPFVYNKSHLVRRENKLFANTSTTRPVTPEKGPVKWGEGFPFIANQWIDNFFFDSEQKECFTSWLHWAYKHAVDGTPRKGQSMFLVGGTNKGKTLMSHRLLSGLFGGHADVSEYLMGQETSNNNMFQVGLATVDDQQASADYKTHLKFSALVKRLTANQTLSMRALYNDRVDLEWLGRVFVTMNEDPESIQMLPNLDINNLDKVIILRTSKDKIDFPMDVEDVIKRELPFFARYIYDYIVPKKWIGDARFGINSFADPELLEEVKFNTPEHSVIEILEIWKESYFTAHPTKTEWFGGVTQLVREICTEFSGDPHLIRDFKGPWLSKRLKTIISKYSMVKYVTRNGKKGYLIPK